MNLYPYESENIEKVRDLSPECMVLLKSNGAFPLDEPGKIALYGNAARKTIKGGTGSGDVNVRHYTTVEEGLENAGFTVTTKAWLDSYDTVWSEANRKFKSDLKAKIAAEGVSAIMLALGAIMPEPEYEIPLQGEGDTAVYVLGRISGEGTDRTDSKGDFRLTDSEVRDILHLQKHYSRFMLVLNVGGVVDLSPVVNKVDNILLLSQLGIAIGDAFADVLLGKAYPSGKLASTWAPWEDYCHVGDFGEHDDTRYREGIYVGYRYFDSVGKEPMFHFGYGLGYTTFNVEPKSVAVNDSNICVTADVTNTGAALGKEVVQLYVSVPAIKLDQPYQTLAAFAKTHELRPGDKTTVTLAFRMEELASFDQDTACSILECGNYILHLGTSSRNTTPCGIVRIEETAVVQKLSHCCGEPDFVDWKPENRVIAQITAELPVVTAGVKEIIPKVPYIDENAVKLVKGMPECDLINLCTGAYNGSTGSNSVIGNAGITVAGAAGETTGIFSKEGIPALIMADGPAGLRLSRQYGVDEKGVYSMDSGSLAQLAELLPEPMLAFFGAGKQKEERHGEVHDQYCTAIPIGTALAQSWSEEVCDVCGDLVGNEMERFGVHIWLAPALNIHRLPLCGRNFEYHSEDPLISGKMAAAITRGVQRHPGRGVSIKHFCCNNQETNRMHSNSVISQRALRDIYLRGFRIVVDEAEPATIMSSYNLLNGEHTSQRSDLLETILRQEWGYKGIIMSDWVAGNIIKPEDKYPGAFASAAIRAGNDIMMPGAQGHFDDMKNALEDPARSYPLTRAQIEKCAARMIELSWKLGK